MRHPIAKFYEFLARPLKPVTRLVLAAAVVPLALSFTQPLWRIAMVAPQYPDGLSMDIYSYQLTGGHDGQDINEINELNHYIGMRHIDRGALSDLDWIPFALGFLLLFALRVAAVGDVRSMLDLFVLTSYVSLFAFARFVYRLYQFGHDLDPHAAVRLAPFMPVVLGTKQVANFTTRSYPLAGSFLLGAFVAALVALTGWELASGRRRAEAEERTSPGLATRAA